MTRLAPLMLAALVLTACQSNPKQTVLALDTTDPRWDSAECVAARKAAAAYYDGEHARGAVALAGWAAGVPAAGAAASAALSAAQQDEREDLNNEIRAACISDPMAGKK